VGLVAEIDDLYLILRAQTAPLTEGFLTAGTAGEELAANLSAAMTEITVAVDRMATNVRVASGSIDEMALKGRIEYDRLAASATAASVKMEAATAKAAASNEALGVSMAATPVRAGPSAKALGLVALAAAAGGVELVKMAGNFESATVRLVTSAGETNANLDLVRQGILHMAGDVGTSADDLARAMYTIESGGQHGAEGLKVLRAAAEGAKTENADLRTVADAVTSVLQDYHLKADAAATVTSKLVAAVGAGKTTFQELTGSLHSVLPIASSAGISLEDITGALASMTVHGMSADQAAQNLADTIKHMVAPTTVQTKELGQLGMSSSELADKLGKRGLTGTLQDLSQLILSHMGPSGRVLMSAFSQSKDAARDANVMIAAMPKSLQDMARGYQAGTMSLGDWRKELKGLPPEQANLLAQFAALQNRASGFNDLLKSGSPSAQTYQDALRRVTGDATGLTTALMLTGENTGYVNDAVKKVSTTTTEAGGHVKGWSEIQGTFNQKLADAKSGLGALGIEVGTKLLPAVTKLVEGLADAAKWLSRHQTIATLLAIALGVLAVGFTVAAIAVWAMNSALLANPITWIVIAIVAAIAILVIGIYELVKHWKTVWGFIKDIAMDVWHFLVDVWHAIAKEAAKIWNDDIVGPIKTAWDTVGHWLDNAVDFFKKLPGRIVTALTELPGKLATAAQKAMDALLYAIGYGIGMVIKEWMDLPGQVWSILKSLWSGATTIFSKGVDAVVGFFVGLKNTLLNVTKELWSTVTSAFSTGISKAVGFVQALPGRIASFFNTAKTTAINTASALINGVIDFFKQLPGRTASAISGLPGAIKKVLSGAGDWLYSTGQDIIHGLINGVMDAVGGAIDAAKHAIGQILQGAKDAIGVHSPSTKFRDEVGHWIPHGIAAGIDAASGVAVDAVAKLAGAMAGSVALKVPVGVAAAGTMTGSSWGSTLAVAPSSGRTVGVPSPTGGGKVVVENHTHVYIGDREIQEYAIRSAQRTKLRNGNSLLT
jgi:TP901 family phage tail tape measure protein